MQIDALAGLQDVGDMPALTQIFGHPGNEAVLAHLGLRTPGDVVHFESAADASPYDEGGTIFFRRFARSVPAAARCSLNATNVLAHDLTGRIFAVHFGRFTVALRPDFATWDDGVECYLCDLLGETTDGEIDLRSFGPEWRLFSSDSDADAQTAFRHAYQFAEA